MTFAFVAAFSVSICLASVEDVMNYYNNDPDYIYITTHQGTFYLYRPSIDVQEYNPPHYQIAGHVIHVNGFNGGISHWYPVIRYNWYTKETFHRNEYGNWEKDFIKGTYGLGAGGRNRKFADVFFRAAYNMDFYGY